MAEVHFQGVLIHTEGHLPQQGKKSPDFSLVDGQLRNRSLGDFRGKRKLIATVPSLDTPVCSLSAKKFNDAAKRHPDIFFLFVSADLPFAQKRVCGLEHIDNILPLSMMRSKDFATAYGVLIKDGALAGLCARAVFVLDTNDIIEYVELVHEITEEPNYQKALAALNSINYQTPPISTL